MTRLIIMPKYSAVLVALILSVLAVLTGLASVAAAQPMPLQPGQPAETPAAVWTARFDPPVVEAGGTVTLELVQHIPDGYHGYVIGTPDSGGMETVVDDDKLPGLTRSGEWQQPATEEFQGHPVLFGTCVFRRELKVASDIGLGVKQIKLTLISMICDEDQCYPPKEISLPLVLTVKGAAQPTAKPVTFAPGEPNAAVWTFEVVPATLAPGETGQLRVRVTMPEGHHTYTYTAVPMGDMSEPMATRVVPDVSGAAGVTVNTGGIQENHATFTEFDEVVVGPTGEFTMPITVAADAAAGARELKVTIQFNECDHMGCFPPVTHTASVPFTVGAAAPPSGPPADALTFAPGGDLSAHWTFWTEPAVARRGETVKLHAKVEVAEGHHTYLPKKNADDPMGTELAPDWASAAGLSANGAATFSGHSHDLFGETVVGPDGTFTVPMLIAKDAEPGKRTLKVKLVFNECDEMQCWPPVTHEFEIGLEISDAAAVEPSINVVPPPATGGTNSTGTGGTTTSPSGKGNDTSALEFPPIDWAQLFPFLGMAFLGGIILNLMPCVLPVLGIKVLGFVEAAHDSQTTPLVHSLAFTAGVLAAFWALAAVMVGLQLAGSAAGWGFQMSNPIFVYILIVFLIMFALNLFGVFEIGTSLQSMAGGVKKKSGLTGSFVTGITATIVATPCTAPFMGSALGFTSSQPPLVTVLILTMIGLGMSAPYIILAMSPALLKRIPRPGPWMVSLKQLMGFLLLAFIPWLLWLYTGLVGRTPMMWSMVGLVVACIGAWIYGKWYTPMHMPRTRQISLGLSAFLGMGSLFFGVAFALIGYLVPEQPAAGPSENAPVVAVEGELPWQPYDKKKLAELRAAGTPVLVDYTADWCLTCQQNARNALNQGETIEYFRQHGIIAMVADYTKTPANLTADLKAHGRRGVPLVLYYPPNGAEPIVLPNIMLGPGAALDPIKEADAKAGPVGKLPWRTHDPAMVAGLRESGQPVLVYYWDSWGLVPMTNMRQGLDQSETIAFFAERRIVPVTADFTRTPDWMVAELQQFGRRGTPLGVYYPADGGKPVMLPNLLLGPDDVISTIEAAERHP